MDAQIEIDIQVFNALKAEVGADFMLELVETYCEDARQQMAILQSAVEQGDAETFTRAAHSLKSTSLSLGALAFGSLARALEMLGREGQLAKVHEIFQQMKNTCDPLTQTLKDLCYDQS